MYEWKVHPSTIGSILNDMHGDELYGNLTKITGPGGKIVMLPVSDPDQVAQICLNEEVFQKNKPNKHSPLGIIWGNEKFVVYLVINKKDRGYKMRSFGGPRSRRGKSGASKSIHETIIMHRELGTFNRRLDGKGSSLLSAAWQANQDKDADNPEASDEKELDLDKKDDGPFSN